MQRLIDQRNIDNTRRKHKTSLADTESRGQNRGQSAGTLAASTPCQLADAVYRAFAQHMGQLGHQLAALVTHIRTARSDRHELSEQLPQVGVHSLQLLWLCWFNELLRDLFDFVCRDANSNKIVMSQIPNVARINLNHQQLSQQCSKAQWAASK